ncbi:MAG TPA: hemolysin family protein [Cyclobacteriaceae bacterium]|nr:hemolysin family protein [Cyclobacteriaceae bacterium]
MTFDLILTIALVLLNGFFVAAEFAIVKVRSSQIAVEKGNLSRDAATRIIGNLDGYLAATQLGITLASLGLGWVGEDVFSKIVLSVIHGLGFEMSEAASHAIAIPLAFATLTFLHIVFGELAPKTIAIRYPTSTTLRLSLPLQAFYIVFRPFIWLLNGFANIILKAIGIRPMNETEIHSEEELKLIIAESEEGGAIEQSERELIQNVFDFDDRVVRQVMVPRVKISALRVNSPIPEVMDIVLKEGYSRYPVFENSLDDIVGIAHAKDIIGLFIAKSDKGLKDVMRPVHFVPETKPIDSLLREFQKMKTQLAIVVSEFGGNVGLVTLEDILEELVGDIQDEHDHEQQIVQPLEKDRYLIQALSSLHDINKFMQHSFPESEEYETLAGLLTFHLPPLREGDEKVIFNYKIKVIKLSKTLPEVVEAQWLGAGPEKQ